MMIISRRHHLAPALAALVCLSFTNGPSVPAIAADSTWEAVLADMQAPQNPTGKKAAAEEDSTVLFATSDLALVSWPGLSTVGGLGTLPNSPLTGGGSASALGGSALGGGGNNPTPVTPVDPWVPPLTPGSVVPAAPYVPLSQYQP